MTDAPINPVLISVIIPCLCAPSLLSRVLQTLADQDFKNFECIVCDDGSEVPLKEIAFSFSNVLSIKYHRNEKNQGRARTRNEGIKLAAGEIIFFLDVDQIVSPTALNELQKHFSDGKIKSVRANVSLLPSLYRSSNYGKYFNSRFLGQRDPKSLAELNLDNLPPKFFATDSVAVPTSIVKELGGFLEEFKGYGCEDEEFGVRLSERGVPLVWSRTVQVFDADNSLSLERACNRMIEYARSSAPILIRRHPAYAVHSAFALLEKPSASLTLKSRLIRRSLLVGLRPWLASRIVKYLKVHDQDAVRPADRWYQLALVGYYLIGYRLRNRSGGSP